MSTLNQDRTSNRVALCSAIFAGFAYVGYATVRQAFGSPCFVSIWPSPSILKKWVRINAHSKSFFQIYQWKIIWQNFWFYEPAGFRGKQITILYHYYTLLPRQLSESAKFSAFYLENQKSEWNKKYSPWKIGLGMVTFKTSRNDF